MKYAFSALALSAIASAAAIERSSCSFTIYSTGIISGPVGELIDGQVRVGGKDLAIPEAEFYIENDKITDEQGRGCILTPPTTQFQCDVGATPTGGFSIGEDGVIYHDGSSVFYACPASEEDWNFYTVPVKGQKKCGQVTLTASGCFDQGSQPTQKPKPTEKPTPKQETTTVTVSTDCSTPAPPAPPPKTSTAAPPPPPPPSPKPQPPPSPKPSPPTNPQPSPKPNPGSSKNCPANLSGSYQYPHLIVPVDSSKPSVSAGTSYNGFISSTTSTIFNFDIPNYYKGTCSLIFLFPQQKDLQTSSYQFSGPGTFGFTQLSNVATQGTNYGNKGGVMSDFGVVDLMPGSSTVVASFPCPAGQAVSFEMKSVGGTKLTFFQDYNPSPIGLYITAC